MRTINFNDEDIKESKKALVNQKLTSLQSAFLMQYINNIETQLEASEKAKQDAIHCIRTELLCFDNESVEYIEGLKVLKILDIDKGE